MTTTTNATAQLATLDANIASAIQALDTKQVAKLKVERIALVAGADADRLVEAERLRQEADATIRDRGDRGRRLRDEVSNARAAEIAESAAKVVALGKAFAAELTHLGKLSNEGRHDMLSALSDITNGKQTAAHNWIRNNESNVDGASRWLVIKLGLAEGDAFGLSQHEPESFVQDVTSWFAKLVRVAGGTAMNETKTVATFAKNQRGDFVRVALSEYAGARLVDVRQTFVADGGAHVGTKKGINIGVHLLDTLIEGLCSARTEAYRRGWLVDEKTQKAA